MIVTCIHVQIVIVLINVHRSAHLWIVITAKTRGLDRRLVLWMLLMMVLLHPLIIGGRSDDLLLLQL